MFYQIITLLNPLEVSQRDLINATSILERGQHGFMLISFFKSGPPPSWLSSQAHKISVKCISNEVFTETRRSIKLNLKFLEIENLSHVQLDIILNFFDFILKQRNIKKFQGSTNV